MADTKYDPAFCEVALAVLSRGKSLAAVCAELDICRPTLYEWRDRHPEFAKAVSMGLQKAQSRWEQIGEEGITGEIKNFSPTPWIFTMKNRFRDDYADKKDEDKSLETSILEKIISGELKVKND